MAVSHVKSNPVADFTGTVTVNDSAGNTATMAATDMVRPSDWNSVHNEYWTFGGNTAGASTLSGANMVLAGGNNITLSANGSTLSVHGRTDFLTTAMQSNAATISNINLSAGTTSNNLSAFTVANSNGISFGLNGSVLTGTVATNYQSQGAYLTTAMLSNAATISNIKVSAGAASALLSDLTFANSNGLAFGFNASTITGSYTVPTVTNSSWTVSDNATSLSISRLAFTQSNGMTLSLSTAAGAATVIGSYTVPTVTNSSWTVSDAVTSQTIGRLAFTNSNGITMTLSTSNNGNATVFASHNALTSQSNQAASNSAGSFTFQTLNFSDANNVTWGTSAGSIVTASVAAGLRAGVSTGGNTAGSTGTVNTGTVVFVGSNGITLSQSTGAAGSNATITISGLGSTLSAFAAVPGQGVVPGVSEANGGAANHSTLWLYPISISHWLVCDHMKFMGQFNVNTSAAASIQRGMTFWAALYTLSNETLISRLYSTSYTAAASHNSNASLMLSMITAIGNSTSYNTTTSSSAGLAVSTAMHGSREMIMPLSSTLTPGKYWIAHSMSSSSAGAAGVLMNMTMRHYGKQDYGFPMGFATTATNATLVNWMRSQFLGNYSVTSAAFPDSIGVSDVSALGLGSQLGVSIGTGST